MSSQSREAQPGPSQIDLAGLITAPSPAVVEFRFSVPPRFWSGRIKFLLGVLDPDAPAALDPPSLITQTPSRTVPLGECEHHVMNFLNETLQTGLVLLHAMHVPQFVPLVTLGTPASSATDNKWIARIAAPEARVISPTVFADVLQLAARLVRLGQEADLQSPRQRSTLFAIVERALQNLKRTHSKSTFSILGAAHQMGVPWLLLPDNSFQLGWGVRSKRFQRSSTQADSMLGVRWSHDKRYTASILREAGLPGPTHLLARDFANARRAADQLGYPVVVKPADRDRGEGVSVDVFPDKLEQATALAVSLSVSGSALVEKQVPGTCHRLFIADYRMLYAVKRLPQGVYGNGTDTIASLVEQEVATQALRPPWKRSGIKPLDPLALNTLEQQGLSPGVIPPAGIFVALRRIETTAEGGVDEDVTAVVHPANVELATSAARLFGLQVAGVDIMSVDIAVPWHVNGAIINEINFAPSLGDGEISRRHLTTYVSRLVEGDGKIPVFAYGGDPSGQAAARRQWRDLRANGTRAVLVSKSNAIGYDGTKLHLTAVGLGDRVRALCLRQDVEAIILTGLDEHLRAKSNATAPETPGNALPSNETP